ncbi:MAG: coniferyl aldehyde dehydrogenase [Deltaproteobacteria bacterium]|nr:coniferyl aldehyde dehydrogenase [Deltaproteobacteria bacterium]
MTATTTPTTPTTPSTKELPAQPRAVFETLKRAWREQGGLSYEQRMDYLDKVGDALKRYEERLAAAIDKDFGNRSKYETAIAEMFTTLNALRYVRRHLRGWMRPERRAIEWVFLPGRNQVVHQPLGVVGVIGPWNYPVYLVLVPLIYAIAAGNRVAIKPSEITPHTTEVLAELIAEVFPRDLVGVVTGGPDVGAAFTKLPFDHLFFTGSTSVGRHVMRAAAENLVPVTLELGGKSPCVVAPEFPIEKAAERIMAGKCLNAGQTCIAPDYALVHESRVEAFVQACEAVVRRSYPTLAKNPDFTSIVSERHYTRLRGLVEEARGKGARVVELNPAGEALPAEGRKIAPTLVIGAPDDTGVMQDEVFGPIMAVVPYKTVDEAIAYVNDRPRPLALYYFDRDGARIKRVLRSTTSGGVTVNDTMLHIAQDDMPFGGVGPSGMGSCHGVEGFLTFSHKKAVFHQARFNTAGLLSPPFGKALDRLLNLLVGKANRR